MTNRPAFAVILVTMALLSACGTSPRSHYYLLSADATASGPKADAPPSIGVGPILIPEYLRGREIILKQGRNRLKVSDFDRWAEPLDAGISRVLLVNLATLLDTRSVAMYPWRRDQLPDYALRVLVVSLAVQGGNAELLCEWSLSNPGSGETLYQSISRLQQPVADNTPASAAAAYSELLLQLSEEVSAAVRSQREQGPGMDTASS